MAALGIGIVGRIGNNARTGERDGGPVKKALVIGGAIVAVVVLTAGGLAWARRDSEPASTVTVGILYPTTGAQAEGGGDEKRGVELAAQWANDHGGIQGRTLELKAADISRPEEAPDAMRGLANQGVSIVVGSHGSAVSAAAAQVATEDNLAFFETGAVGQIDPSVLSGRNFFRLAPMGANLGASAINFVRDEVIPAKGHTGPVRYAVAYVDDPYGRSVAAGAQQAAQQGANGSLVGSFGYQAAGTDFDALAKQIGDVHPDVLFVAAYIDDGVALREAVVHAGIPLIANIGTSSSFCHPEFGDRLGNDAVGVFASDKPDAADVNPNGLNDEGRAALTWVQAEYKRLYHEDMSAPALSGFSNAYAVFVHVLPAAPTLDAAGAASAALKVKLPEGSLANGGGLDLAGPGSIDPGANLAAAGVIWEWIAPRTRAVVYPPSMATHQLVLDP
jgi:ABC-type branched-subunit amino acid transport system substrate-binding protein